MEYNEMVEVESEILVLDSVGGTESNWLRYVNYASNPEEVNLVAVQRKSGVFYVTCKAIPPNEELLVLYPGIIVQETEGPELIVPENIQRTKSAHNSSTEIIKVIPDTRDPKRAVLSQPKTCVELAGKPAKQDKLTSKLKFRERIHSRDKLYQCKICFRKFSEKRHLNNHNMIHTRKRPYKCSECEKQFCLELSLKVHERIHTGEKHECKSCGRKFSQNGHLVEHEKTHK